MSLRDSLKALGLSAVGAGAELALGWAEGLQKAAGQDDQDETGKATRDPTPDGGDIPTDQDLALGDPKSMFWDPFAIIEQLGYKERPTQITYGTLRAIFYKMPIVSDVIQTRVQQVAAFARPQHDRYDIGFRLKLRDQEAKPKSADKKWIKEMEGLLMHTGVHDDPRHRDDFETFLRKLIWDSLVYDQACIEVVPNRKGTPAQWYAVDASTIRLADTASAYQKKKTREDTRYVQIYDGMIITEYNTEQLCFGIRNPRTDMKLYGYGTSELEMVMIAITSLLWGWQYNQRFFSQGSATKGILNFKGAIPEAQLKAFRRHWYTMISGVENAWRTPITNADDLQWLSVMETNKDMEFSAWMDFLIKVFCGAYQMNPVEVNFQYGNVGQKGGLNEANNKEKITESKERGLRPLLRFLAKLINTHIVWPINDNFEFEFVGLDAGTQDDTAKLNQMRVKTTRTIDELRAEDDYEPMPDGMGEVILDPVYLQWAQLKQAQEQGLPPPGMGNGSDPFGGNGNGDGDGGEEPGKDENGDIDFDALFGESDDDDDDEDAEDMSERAKVKAKAKAEAKAERNGKKRPKEKPEKARKALPPAGPVTRIEIEL